MSGFTHRRALGRIAVALVAAASLGLASGGSSSAVVYGTNTTTSVDTHTANAFAYYGSKPVVTATISSNVGYPTGSVTFAVDKVGGQGGTSTPLAEGKHEGNTYTSVATYTLPDTAPAGHTYTVTATYTKSGNYVSGSSQSAVTIFNGPTHVSIGTNTGTSVKVTVTSDTGGNPKSGSVTYSFTYHNKNNTNGAGSGSGVTASVNGSGVATVTGLPSGKTVTLTVSYGQQGTYAASDSATTTFDT